MVEHNNTGPSALTDVEFEISHKMVCLRSLVYVYYKKLWSDGIDNLRREVHLMLQKLDEWLSVLAKESKPGDFATTTYCFELSSNFAIPDWNYFHTKYSCLEICRFTNLALDYVLSESSKYKLLEPSVLSELSASIKESIAEIYSNIKQHASALQSSLQKKVSVEKFIELGFGMPDDNNDVVGLELRNLVSEPKMEEIASDVCESWVDALEGLIRVKPL